MLGDSHGVINDCETLALDALIKFNILRGVYKSDWVRTCGATLLCDRLCAASTSPIGCVPAVRLGAYLARHVR